MATEFTDKQRFQSKYAVGLYVTDGQYLAELMCERIATKEGKQLPVRFWQLPEWKKVFQFQKIRVDRLLKEYDVSVILKALKDPKANRIYSFGANFALKPILDKYQKEKNKLEKIRAESIENDEDEVAEYVDYEQSSQPRQSVARKNLIGDLD